MRDNRSLVASVLAVVLVLGAALVSHRGALRSKHGDGRAAPYRALPAAHEAPEVDLDSTRELRGQVEGSPMCLLTVTDVYSRQLALEVPPADALYGDTCEVIEVQAVADDEGRFVLPIRRLGPKDLFVWAPGCSPRRVSSLVVCDGLPPADVRVGLRPARLATVVFPGPQAAQPTRLAPVYLGWWPSEFACHAAAGLARIETRDPDGFPVALGIEIGGRWDVRWLPAELTDSARIDWEECVPFGQRPPPDSLPSSDAPALSPLALLGLAGASSPSPPLGELLVNWPFAGFMRPS